MDALMLPLNWQRVRLGDIAEINPPTIIPNVFYYIDLENVEKGQLLNKQLMTKNKAPSRARRLLSKNDILYQLVRPYQRNNYFFTLNGNYVASTGYAQIRTLQNPSFLYFALHSNYFVNAVLDRCEGTSYPAINSNELKKCEVILPPLNEQIAIADILSDVDRYLYNLDALILKKESVKKALRIKMLNQILASNGVEFRELGDIILSLKTGLNPRSFFKLNTTNANNYYVTIRELEDYTIKFTHQTDRIDDNALSLCLKRSNLEKDDILFSGTGTIGKVSIIEKNPNNWAIKEGIYSIKPNKKIVFPRFLMFCLESSNIQNDIKNKSFGGIVKSIPMNDLQQIQIPLPPLNEQIAIANILSDLDHEIISLKNKKRQFDNIKKALNHDLMSAKIRVLKK
ncbi:hypothetical protein BD0084_11650 [Helicobacter pylori]